MSDNKYSQFCSAEDSQSHLCNVVCKGTFIDLCNFLHSSGIDIEVIWPGVIGSSPTIVIDNKENDDEDS